MVKHKPNGDIFVGPVRVFNGFKQSPPNWLMLIGAVSVLLAGYAGIHGLYIALDLIKTGGL